MKLSRYLLYDPHVVSGPNSMNQFDINLSINTPDKPGVFKVHASMKILYIGSSMNLRQSLLESLPDPCIGKARRFSYLVTEKAEQIKDQLLKEYRETHRGNLPACMDK